MFKGEPRFNRAETEVSSEAEKELLKVGEETGNKLEIVRPMGDMKNELQFNPETVDTKKINSVGIDLIPELLRELENFDNKPIIKDSFKKDNASRRDWEKEKFFPEVSEKITKYYNSNLLMKSNLMRAQNLISLSMDLELFKNGKEIILVEIGKELGGIMQGYNAMGIEDKMQAVEDVGKLNKKIIDIISIPNTIRQN